MQIEVQKQHPDKFRADDTDGYGTSYGRSSPIVLERTKLTQIPLGVAGLVEFSCPPLSRSGGDATSLPPSSSPIDQIKKKVES